MKIFTAKAKKGSLKYYDEHISCSLVGENQYDWRKLQDEMSDSRDLSLPGELEFITSKVTFKNLDTLDWPMSDFRVPIFHNRFIDVLTKLDNIKFKVFPIAIKDSKNELNINNNFSAIYINSYFECIVRELSQSIENKEPQQYDYRDTKFMNKINYPTLFKIKDISTPFMHFITEENINKLKENGITGLDFRDVSKITN